MSFRVLHIGLEKQWRGGENQIRLLIENAPKEEFQFFVAYPNSSQGIERFEQLAEVCSLPSRSGSDPRSIVKIINFCRKNHIQILHTHSSAAQALGLSVKKWLPNLKLVVHRRVDFPIADNFFTKRKYLSPKVDRYLAISKCIQSRLEDYGISPEKISLAPSAIDSTVYDGMDSISERSRLITQARVAPDEPLIGMAAAMTSEKGHEVLIKACLRLEKQKISFHCFLAGSGELEDDLRQLVEDLDLKDKISFVGFKREVAGFLSGLDVLVVPSFSEGLGTIVLEGISAGCAVIGSRVGGIPEMIIDKETGLLFEPGDDEGLFLAIKNILEDRKLREQMQTNARNHMQKNFSLQRMLEVNLSTYRSLI